MFAEKLEPDEVSPKILGEMLRVGIIPIEDLEHYGKIETLHGKQIRYGRESNRTEFFHRLIEVGLNSREFSNLPTSLKFQVLTEE